MPTFRLLVEYDGSRFVGWQAQASGRTVQGTLLEALRSALGEQELDLQGAGRTDSGVHALGQVASLRCRTHPSATELYHDLERRLPQDLAVLEVREAARGFHARHDATGRAYRYQLALRRSAFGKRYTWWIPERLSVPGMAKAAAGFVGRHDFGRLARHRGDKESTLVEVENCEVAARAGVIVIRFVASHFLWNQVRRMVGALVEVGRGHHGPEEVSGWLDGTRTPPPLAAPAAGLFLEAVRYPGEPFALPGMEPVGVPWRPGAPERW